MRQVASKDATSIAFDQMGEGPAVILVNGAFADRSVSVGLATLLAPHFTVYYYDRRGRGDSGDTPPYAVEREVEDIEALVAESGGSACLFGASSGAALALEAAASGLAIARLALWEPPYILEASRRPPADAFRVLSELVAAGRRGDAAGYFMTKVVGLPPQAVVQARKSPYWHVQEALAHTLAYDVTILGDFSVPADRAALVQTPTLVMASGVDFPWMRETAQALAAALPNGKVHFLEGQGHGVDPAVLAPVLVEFFG